MSGPGAATISHSTAYRDNFVQSGYLNLKIENVETLQVSASCAELPVAQPDNIPARDPYFQGRTAELDQLHAQLHQGSLGAVAAYQGLGGQGKTALALEFAYRYVVDYPGGRAKLDAESHEHLHTLLRELVPLIFQSDPRVQDTLKPVLALPEDKFLDWLAAELRRRPRLLLLLDNVDRPALLARQVRDRLPGPKHLHLVVTTRIEPAALHLKQWVEVDKLPLDDALKLLRSHREFADASEEAAARDLVTRLDGYTIAVEAAAVWLAEHTALTVRAFFDQLIAGGLKKFEGEPGVDRLQLSRHKKSQLTAVLAPVLASLTPLQRRVLDYAALLPADCIPLPWLRELVEEVLPIDGGFHGDPWVACVQRLDGLRLLRSQAVPQLAHMHRLVQEILANRAALMPALSALALRRGRFLIDNWVDHTLRWEIEPLRQFAIHLIELNDQAAIVLANLIQEPLCNIGQLKLSGELLRALVARLERNGLKASPKAAVTFSNLAGVEHTLGNLPEARRLLRQAIKIEEAHLDPDDPALAVRYSNLAVVEKHLGNWPEARQMMQWAIEIDEKYFGPDHSILAIRYSNLAGMEIDSGNLSEGRRLLLRVIEIQERHFETNQPEFINAYSNLAMAELELGNLPEAKRLLLRAIEIHEQHLPLDHPNLALLSRNLAMVEKNLENLPEARRLLLRAIDIESKHFHPQHPTRAATYYNFAAVEKASGNLPESRRLLLQAIEICEKHFEPGHPELAHCHWGLGRLEKLEGKKEEARKHLKRAEEVFRSKLGPDHPRTQEVHRDLASLD